MTIEWFFGALIVGLLIVGAVLIGTAGPSCEEQGGRTVYQYSYPMLVGKVIIVQPVYTCELQK